MPTRHPALAWLPLLLGCEGSHADLGVDDGTTSASVASVSAASSSVTAGAGTGGMAPIEEPDGPPRLTVVHGVVDRDHIQLCLTVDGQPSTRPPFPQAGIGFGTGLAVALPSDDVPVVAPEARVAITVVASNDPVTPTAVPCGDLLANPAAHPELTVLAYGVVAGDTFAAPRSLLLVPGGCFGGEGHESPKQENVCGTGYTPETPTPTLLFGPMSRVTKLDRLGVQVAHAASALPNIDVRLVRSDVQATQFEVAKLVPQGGIFPFPPYAALDLDLLGEAASAEIRTGASTSPQPIPGAGVFLGPALAAGGHEVTDLKNGGNLVLVGVGAMPGEAEGAWWKKYTIVAVTP